MNARQATARTAPDARGGAIPTHARDNAAGPSAAVPPTIEVRGLSKTYRSKREGTVLALDDISFTVEEGEFVCIVGPSGCGKSTLLKILAGIVAHSVGTVAVRGKPPSDAQNRLGLVFQAPVLLPWRTVLQNTLLPAQVLGLDPKAAEARAHDLLRMVGLEQFASSYPNELSGGMQQRCSITRALLHDPSILLMDEPFGALDAMTRDTMNLELQRIWRESGKTIFLITHSIPEAVFLADRVLVMSARPGRIVEEIKVDLPRPRDLDTMSEPAFAEAVRHIRGLFGIGGKERPHVD
ncbi:ABC transporter ATP-binding protein [Aquabacter spiritensis]|uniref:NitT/TauT family transport system ATP-binding protein n=1 Tax=Aquabacter spiritensis TaxID=933073 RepID=A0A4R3M1V4_9HYPH|nr:ABC transporter ATP-binding protein [Aquabacter spiritensis]TCT06169.1 NitT/TauT family transport system ATP-binding protein [Aquabacter spiritensis]